MSEMSRRQALKAIAMAASAPAFASKLTPLERASNSKNAVPVVGDMVHERFKPLIVELQSITGMLANRMKVNVEGRLLSVNVEKLLAGFTHRSKVDENDWSGEHVGKFLDAACNCLRYSENVKLRETVENVAFRLTSAQSTDGYLGTYPDNQRWSGWDVWVHKYNLIGLMSYYRLTGTQSALSACRRMGILLCQTFGDDEGKRSIVESSSEMGMAATSVLEPICTLYQFTGDKSFLEFAQYIVRAYEHAGGPKIISSLLAHGSVYRTANGKAYEMLSNFNGIVDLYRLTGDPDLLSAVTRAWQDIVNNQLYWTGTMSSREHFQTPGTLLTLPSSDVGETCVTVTWLQLNFRLLKLTGEARFAHEIERTTYNHLLAAQDANSGDFCYYTSFFGPKEYTSETLCCVSSGPRGISLIPELIWGLDAQSFAVNLYVPAISTFELNGAVVNAECRTRFPEDGNVSITLRSTRIARFKIRLRVPEWSTNFEVSYGGRVVTGRPGEMVYLEETWPTLAQLYIRMDLPVRILKGEGTYKSYVALARGPQLLAADKAANPQVPYLNRTGLAGNRFAESPELHQIRAAHYELSGIAGIPERGGGMLRLAATKLVLQPFADVREYSVWVAGPGEMRSAVPPASAFARARISVEEDRQYPLDGREIQGEKDEFLTDENPNSFCGVDPRNLTLSRYLGKTVGKPGDPVWFILILPRPAVVSRVVFRHGPVTAQGGWFDTSEVQPLLQISTRPIPMYGRSYFPSIESIKWEDLTTLTGYPAVRESQNPLFLDRQTFLMQLPKPMIVTAIRVIGRPGGDCVTCAEFSAHA